MPAPYDMIQVKLIRDRLTDRRADASKSLASGPEILALALVNKLHEEVSEVAGDMGDVHEYADVLEVLRELAELNGIDWGAVEATRLLKRAERGGFSRGIISTRYHRNATGSEDS